MSNIEYKSSYGPNEDAFKIRIEVFVGECGVGKEDEIDESDETAYQVVIYVSGQPAATGRLYYENGLHRLGRICALKQYRGMGLAEIAVGLLLKKAQEDSSVTECYLSGRTYILPLYRKFGFKETGEPFIHDNMEQYHMYVSKNNIKYTQRFLDFINQK